MSVDRFRSDVSYTEVEASDAAKESFYYRLKIRK